MKSNVVQQRVPVASDSGHWVHVSESPRHVRVFFNGATVADSKRAKLVRESDVLPVYYFPHADVHAEFLAPSGQLTQCPYKGEASYRTVQVNDRRAENAAWMYPAPMPAAVQIADHFAFEWSKMEKWMEEDEEIFVHPRDPYKRVDVLPSRRHVRVLIDGQTVGETRQPSLVFETNHPVRYYLPPGDVRVDLLIPSATRSRCPYKGQASYWSVKIGSETFNDLVWGYLEPIPECPKIRGLLCFFHECGAEIYVDGEKIPPPATKWSRPLRKG